MERGEWKREREGEEGKDAPLLINRPTQILILKVPPKNRLPARPIPLGEVPGLDHEPGDDTVYGGPFVV